MYTPGNGRNLLLNFSNWILILEHGPWYQSERVIEEIDHCFLSVIHKKLNEYQSID